MTLLFTSVNLSWKKSYYQTATVGTKKPFVTVLPLERPLWQIWSRRKDALADRINLNPHTQQRARSQGQDSFPEELDRVKEIGYALMRESWRNIWNV